MDTAYKTTLELDKVLNRAVQLCACQETKEMMQALEPAPTIEDERYDLTQTNAINALLIKNGSPRFGSVREVRRIVAHARKGGILSMGGAAGNCRDPAQFLGPVPVVRPERA